MHDTLEASVVQEYLESQGLTVGRDQLAVTIGVAGFGQQFMGTSEAGAGFLGHVDGQGRVEDALGQGVAMRLEQCQLRVTGESLSGHFRIGEVTVGTLIAP